MSFFSDLNAAWHLATDMRGVVGHHRSMDDARTRARTRLAQRNDTFLQIVEQSIYANPRSPYFALLKNAQCELGDLRGRIKACGIEETLRELRRAGVYITFNEFKGRAPLVRGGLELKVQASDFDNPMLAPTFYSETGGSSGTAQRVARPLQQYATLWHHQMLVRHAQGVLDAPFGVWRGILPDGSGLNNNFYPTPYGRVADRWFTQIKPFGSSQGAGKYSLYTYYYVLLARLYGVRLPFPQYVPIERALVVAQWAHAMVQAHGACLIATTVSRGLRVCLAARAAGLDLSGVKFMIAGEPLTPGKARGITDAGANYFSTYGMTEAGRVAMGCAAPLDCTDVHVMSDSFALIPFDHPIEGFDLSVPAFHVTTLYSASPKLMLNVEIDDYGVVEERACGCELGALGYTTHLRQIRSYSKLTGEGVTLVGSDMVRILEEVLPARFGGTPLDYQLLEQEDEAGLTRLSLVISPRVVIRDERAVIDTVLAALRQTSIAADAARSTWEQAGTLQIKRMEPIWTARGKFMPLHIQRHITAQNTGDTA